MKKQLLYGMMLLLPVAAWAYDFSAVHEGQTLYFDYSWGDEVTVVNQTGSQSTGKESYTDYPSGAVVIPDEVEYEANTYRVTAIGKHAFRNCVEVTSVVIGNNVQSLGDCAFYGCSALQSMVLGERVSAIGYNTFYNCSSLYDIECLSSSLDGLTLDDFEGTGWHKSSGMKYLGTVAMGFVFPEKDYSPSSYRQTSIRLREGTTAIADNAFKSYYVEYTSNSSPTYGCYPLETVEYVIIPRSVKHIGANAFSGCNDALKVITIPDSVNFIGEGAFANCFALERVTWLPENCELEASIFPEDLEEIEFGKAVRNVPDYICENNTAMTSVAIPHEVTSVGDRAFFGCTSLTRVALGASVATLGEMAFFGCTALTTIQSYALTPPAATPYCFLDVPITASVQIPCGCIPAYEAADEWAYFWSFTEIIAYTATGYSSNDEWGTVSVEQTCAEATFRAEPVEGCRFVAWSDGNTDNPRVIPLSADVELVAEFRAETTGIESVWGDGTEVYTHDHTLHIRGNDREATVYDTTGRTVYQGFERAIALDRSGLYIIEIDGRRMKVVL